MVVQRGATTFTQNSYKVASNGRQRHRRLKELLVKWLSTRGFLSEQRQQQKKRYSFMKGLMGFWACPSSGILKKTREHNVSETASVSVLR
jgi:hypothetical protein